MSLLVDNPILNSPFQEPARYWDYKEGQPVLAEGRRLAGYYLKPRMHGPQLSLFEEEFIPLETVNQIRERVRAWRERGYPGATPLTRQLLLHWGNPERERKLFFCQCEAAETLIWLIEAPSAEKQGLGQGEAFFGEGQPLTGFLAVRFEQGGLADCAVRPASGFRRGRRVHNLSSFLQQTTP